MINTRRSKKKCWQKTPGENTKGEKEKNIYSNFFSFVLCGVLTDRKTNKENKLFTFEKKLGVKLSHHCHLLKDKNRSLVRPRIIIDIIIIIIITKYYF